MRSNEPSNKATSVGAMRTIQVGSKTSVLSRGKTRLQAAASSAASSAAEEQVEFQAPQPHPEEPSLHQIPVGLYPEYRPLPTVASIVIVVASVFSSAISTWKRATWLHPLAILGGIKQRPQALEAISFVLKAVLMATFARLVIQDVFLPPSRISIDAMKERYFLPSSLSKYEYLRVPGIANDGASAAVGVHYLKYLGANATAMQAPRFEAVYAHHGFGASSLAWLPTLPTLVDRLGARVGLGHDMVGFGFTERQDDLDWYTTDGSARISKAVYDAEVPGPSSNRPVALFGHSLGSLGVLKMALQLPKETPKFIVLCAPAFGLTSAFAPETTNKTMGEPSILQRVTLSVQKNFAYPVGGYLLRRLVGTKDSWRMGLKTAAWGNPKKVSESDVLRYQWPAIGRGWETGLLNFARAQRRVDDYTLLKSVLDLPNTTVAIILGDKDKVVPSKSIRKFLSNFPEYDIPVIEMEEMGHDAFEEDVDSFVDCVEGLLDSKKWTNLSQ